MTPRLAHGLWHAAALGPWLGFRRAARHPRRAQLRLLRRTLAANRESDYGRRYGFGEIRSVEAYRERVPLVTYDDLRADIEAAAGGCAGVLTAEPVLLFEPSSGSTAATKWIPSTRALKAQFRRAVGAWIFDLFRHRPGLRRGPAYWSVSPLVDGPQRTEGGIPIGFDDDAAYLGRGARRLIDAGMAVPGAVKGIGDVEAFRYATLRFLLGAAELRIVSVWSPTFLTLLLDPLPAWWDDLLGDVERGTLSPPAPIAPGLHARFASLLRPDPSRAAALRAAGPEDLRALWPGLGLISCWTDGPAGRYAEQLARRFPGVPVQGKGLIATEGIVSFPLAGVEGAVPAVTSHFLEFLPHDAPESTRSLLVDELEPGGRYEVVLTTGGGLYRYRLGDVVEVVGRYGALPALRFVGRADLVSDRFGEKLSERFVAEVLEGVFREKGLRPAFALLAPDETADGVRYTLYLEHEGTCAVRDLAEALEAGLRRNFHYAYCRKLGQLGPAAVRRIEGSGAEAYLEACRAEGRRLGDVKIPALERRSGWGERFEGLGSGV